MNEREPKPPKYLRYPTEPHPTDLSGSACDYNDAKSNWIAEVRKREILNRKSYDEYLAAFKAWSSRNNRGTWEPAPNLPKSPLPPIETTGENINSPRSNSLPNDSPPRHTHTRPTPKLSKLTEETIRNETAKGDTPLHRAAKNGQINLIPSHLLRIELFLVRNHRNETPLHVAAKYGTLDKVPPRFLTKQTMTASTEYAKKESRTGNTPPRTETPLHTAALYGHADQIPKQFLTLEFLSIEATGFRYNVLYCLLQSDTLHVIPNIHTNSELLDWRDSRGRTLRSQIESKGKWEAYVARVRSEPASEKQKEKLRWFGLPVHDRTTKGEASDALDKCVRDYPEKEQAYNKRPATTEQMAKIRDHFSESPEDAEGPFTYREAKDLIWHSEMQERITEREEEHRDNIISLVARTDFFPSLTVGRVKNAARALDGSNPGWVDDKDNYNLLLKKVAELNPDLAESDGWLKALLRR